MRDYTLVLMTMLGLLFAVIVVQTMTLRHVIKIELKINSEDDEVAEEESVSATSIVPHDVAIVTGGVIMSVLGRADYLLPEPFQPKYVQSTNYVDMCLGPGFVTACTTIAEDWGMDRADLAYRVVDPQTDWRTGFKYRLVIITYGGRSNGFKLFGDSIEHNPPRKYLFSGDSYI